MTDATLQSDTALMQAGAPCGLIKTNHFGTVIAANERLGEWLDIPATDVCAMPVSHLFSKASRIVFETSIIPLLTLKGHVDGASLDLLGRGGAKTPVLFSASVTGTGDSRVTTFVFLLADARRAFERDLAKARVEAETLLSSSQREGELREQFIAILGHDLRNPLASITSALNILSRETLSEANQHIVTLTRGSIQRMSLLIDNILDFARNRLGDGITLTFAQDATLEREIRQVISELSSAHPDRKVMLDMTNVDDVKCDVSRLGQLLSNLLGNAITYGDPVRPIHVDAKKTNDTHFEMSVRNFGPPIRTSAMERLFDPFVRSDNHGDQMGLGLGLYIASEIAKAHSGRLDVQSTESETVFTLRMPIGQANPAA